MANKMRAMDRLVRWWRATRVLDYIRRGDRLLDVGCYDGYLISRCRGIVGTAVGLDPLACAESMGDVEFVRETFPGSTRLPEGRFDCVTMVAVLEHLPDPDDAAAECFRLLRPGGRVVLTVPSLLVDPIVDVLQRLRLMEAICIEEHHGFKAADTLDIFRRAGFTLLRKSRFQFGLNNLFVFEKPPAYAPAAVPAWDVASESLAPAIG